MTPSRDARGETTENENDITKSARATSDGGFSCSVMIIIMLMCENLI